MPAARNRRKLHVTVIGTGRLGSALAIALYDQGYIVEALVARHRERARKTASLLDGRMLVLAAERLDKLPQSDLIIIATPDDQIGKVVGTLSEVGFAWPQKPAVLHTSGALSSKVLSPLARKGWATGSLHPLVAVSKVNSGAQSLRDAFWCIEGNEEALRLARRLVRDLNGRSFSIDSKEKPLYHAAAVMASGHVVSLFDVALEMLGNCGLSAREAQRILLPLVESTVRNLANNCPAQAMTGTFARGDQQTVQLHLAAMKGARLESARNLYRLLGLRALKLAEKNGLAPQISKQIAESLKQ